MTADLVHRASFYCAGEIMLAHGSQVMSMFAEVITTALKTIRTSSAVSTSSPP
jgi:hypothetical protein